MKKLGIGLCVLALLLGGCGKAITVHCDGCGAEVALEADSKITEDWIVFCKTCEEDKLGGGVIAP